MFSDDSAIVVDYDYSDVPTSQLQLAKTLFETIAEVIGRSGRTTIPLKSNFYEIGGNSLNSVLTVANLRAKGYFIEVGDFIGAKDLHGMLGHISENANSSVCSLENDKKFKAIPLKMEHKNDSIRLRFFFIFSNLIEFI